MQQNNNNHGIEGDDLEALMRLIDVNLSESAARSEELHLQTLRGLAGPHFDRMSAGPEQAKEYLSDPDPRLRLAAMSILSRNFGLRDQLLDHWQRMADSDDDAEVRLHAKLCLVSCYHGKDDKRAKRLLAQVIKDFSLTHEVRLSLYILLMSIGIEKVPWSELREELPSEVDWDVVERVLRSK